MDRSGGALSRVSQNFLKNVSPSKNMNSRKTQPYSIRDSSRRARLVYWFGERVRGWNTTCRHQHITQNFGHVIGWPYSGIYRHIPENSRWAGLARHWDTRLESPRVLDSTHKKSRGRVKFLRKSKDSIFREDEPQGPQNVFLSPGRRQRSPTTLQSKRNVVWQGSYTALCSFQSIA